VLLKEIDAVVRTSKNHASYFNNNNNMANVNTELIYFVVELLYNFFNKSVLHNILHTEVSSQLFYSSSIMLSPINSLDKP